MIRIILLTFLLLFNNSSQAAEINSIKTKHKNGRFTIDAKLTISASPENIFRILTNYQNLPKISPKIISSKILKKSVKNIKVRTVIKGCALFACKIIVNTQLVTSVPNEKITTITLPKESNLKFGKMIWIMKKNGNKTDVTYFAQIEPEFFIPPIIGSFLIKKSMKKEAEELMNNVEKAANIANPNF
ncbi:MAG: hypothetical protein ACJAW3_000568 [Lentimonas sp.]|jgi:hypothetical protein